MCDDRPGAHGAEPGGPSRGIERTPPRRAIRRRELLATLALAILVGGAAGAVNVWLGSRVAPVEVRAPGSLPEGRAAAAMAYDPDTKTTLLFGGQDGEITLDDTWNWNGSGWTELNPSASPPGLSGPVMAYDPDSHALLLVGGTTASPGAVSTASTWAWDGSTWRSEPAAAVGAGGEWALATDTATKQLILVTGGGSQGVATWRWSGGRWLGLDAAASPPEVGLMAFDSETSRLVMVTGPPHPSSAGPQTSLWSWTGSSWALVGTSTTLDPVGGDWPDTLAPSRDGPMLLTSSDTYLWQGGDWVDEGPSPDPRRFAEATAYDSASHQLVVFGGSCLTCLGLPLVALNDTWTWDGRWTPQAGALRPTPTPRGDGSGS